MNITEINPLALPSLPLGERSQLPNLPAIYFVLNGESVLYIGRTVNLSQRWVSHHRYEEISQLKLAKIAWLECSDPALLNEIEQALISYFLPPLNGRNPTSAFPLSRITVDIRGLREEMERLATSEERSLSSMARILISEALASRNQKNNMESK